MAIYIELLHGRTHPDEELNDWGYQGPILGPFPYFHVTYNATVNIGDNGLQVAGEEKEFPWWDKNDLMPFLFSFYGDITIYSEDQLKASPDLLVRVERTKEILKISGNDFPLYVNDPEPWVKQYVTCMLREG